MKFYKQKSNSKNCLACCVGSLLNIPPSLYPTYEHHDSRYNWIKILNKFLKKYNKHLRWINKPEYLIYFRDVNLLTFITDDVSRGHCIITRNGSVLFDPYGHLYKRNQYDIYRYYRKYYTYLCNGVKDGT